MFHVKQELLFLNCISYIIGIVSACSRVLLWFPSATYDVVRIASRIIFLSKSGSRKKEGEHKLFPSFFFSHA